LHEIAANNVSSKNNFFIKLNSKPATNLIYNRTKGLCVANKIISAIFETNNKYRLNEN
jgi:hypothetical protein